MSTTRLFDLAHTSSSTRLLVDGRLGPTRSHNGRRGHDFHDPQTHGRFIIDGPVADLHRIPSQTPAQARRDGANLSLPSDPAWFEFRSRTGNTRLAAVATAKAGRDVVRDPGPRGETLRRLLTNNPTVAVRGLSTVTLDAYAANIAHDQLITPAWAALVILDATDAHLAVRMFPKAGWAADGGDAPPGTDATLLSEVAAAVVYAMWLTGNGRADYTPVPAGPGGLDAVAITESVVAHEGALP